MSDGSWRPDDLEVARLAAQLVRRGAHVSSDELRARSVASLVGSMKPALAVRVVGEVVRAARDHDDAATTQAALGRALGLGMLHADFVAECLGHARSRADRLVEALFAAGPAAREYDVNEEPFVDRQLAKLSAGTKRALAKGRDLDLLLRLAHDQDARVIRDLLQNPRCTEREAVLVASRRPTRANVLETVLASRHGLSRRVRLSVAHNPYAPVALAVRALQGLSVPELDEIARDERLAPELRRHAGALVHGRRSTARERSAPAPEAIDDAELAELLARLAPDDDEERALSFGDGDG